MAEPITTAIGILAVKELAPPIMKETLKTHRERLDDRIAHMSDVCKALNAPEFVEKAMVGAAIVSSLSNRPVGI